MAHGMAKLDRILILELIISQTRLLDSRRFSLTVRPNKTELAKFTRIFTLKPALSPPRLVRTSRLWLTGWLNSTESLYWS